MGRPDAVSFVLRQALEIKKDFATYNSSARITALLPFGRSGSLFLHSLLDGHPEIATLPGVYFKGWFGINRWQHFAPDTTRSDWRERLISRVIQKHQPLFNAKNKQNVPGKPLGNAVWLAKDLGFMEMGTDRLQTFVVDQDAFTETLLRLLKEYQTIDTRSCFELIHTAFEIAVRKKTDTSNHLKHNIFYHIHNPDSFELTHFSYHYPKASFLHLMRNPVQSMESWMLIDLKDNKDFQTRSDNVLFESSYMLGCWSRMIEKAVSMFVHISLPDSYRLFSRGVRLEDIKRDTKKTMPQLAAWMGVSDHPALYESTFCGLKYWGPSSKANGKITGFDTKAIDQPLGRLFGPKDVLIFETLFWPLSRLYGYTDWDESSFRHRLMEIRPMLNVPLEFEIALYANLMDHSRSLEDLPQFRRLHRLLHFFWSLLDRDGTYQNMVEPLNLDL